MLAYPAQWESHYQQELLTLWDLLGPALRQRITPEAFRAWVYQYSEHEGAPPGLTVEDSPDGEESDRPDLLAAAETNYVLMYHYCENLYLPLLRNHQGALDTLQYLCYLSADDELDLTASE